MRPTCLPPRIETAALSLLLVLGGAAGAAEPEPGLVAQDVADAAGCGAKDRDAYCAALCAPAKMVFLPCMAVGSPAMAACREREIASCLAACEERPGPPHPGDC